MEILIPEWVWATVQTLLTFAASTILILLAVGAALFAMTPLMFLLIKMVEAGEGQTPPHVLKRQQEYLIQMDYQDYLKEVNGSEARPITENKTRP